MPGVRCGTQAGPEPGEEALKGNDLTFPKTLPHLQAQLCCLSASEAFPCSQGPGRYLQGQSDWVGPVPEPDQPLAGQHKPEMGIAGSTLG